MSSRPRGRTAERPKLISAEMSTTEASGLIFFSILNIKETRRNIGIKCNTYSFLFFWGFRLKLIISAFVVDMMSTTEAKVYFGRN